MPSKLPLKIGVTGGIGAGKTLVCNIFSLFSIPIYHADHRAKMLLVEDATVVSAIKERFGDIAYHADGTLNRIHLADNVFADADKLRIINGIVHPAVAADFKTWCNTHSSQTYVVKEAALLVESGSYKELDRLITVTAPENVRIRRVLERDKTRTLDQIKKIIAKQLSEEEKVAVSTHTICNDGQSLLIPQVLSIHQSLINIKLTG